jgi:hypothetical protein
MPRRRRSRRRRRSLNSCRSEEQSERARDASGSSRHGGSRGPLCASICNSIHTGENKAPPRESAAQKSDKCSHCHEIWELLPTRFPKYKRKGGSELYRKTCRFCVREVERLTERARTALKRASTGHVVPSSGRQLHRPAAAVMAETAHNARLTIRKAALNRVG